VAETLFAKAEVKWCDCESSSSFNASCSDEVRRGGGSGVGANDEEEEDDDTDEATDGSVMICCCKNCSITAECKTGRGKLHCNNDGSNPLDSGRSIEATVAGVAVGTAAHDDNNALSGAATPVVTGGGGGGSGCNGVAGAEGCKVAGDDADDGKAEDSVAPFTGAENEHEASDAVVTGTDEDEDEEEEDEEV